MNRRSLLSALVMGWIGSVAGCIALRTVPDVRFENHTNAKVTVEAHAVRVDDRRILDEQFELLAEASKRFDDVFTQASTHALSIDVSNGVSEQFEWSLERLDERYGVEIHIYEHRASFGEILS